MRTRRGSYSSPSDGITFSIRPSIPRRRRLTESFSEGRSPKLFRRICNLKASPLLDALPDDLLIHIMTFVGSTASSPADVFNPMLACRRFCAAATRPQVLANIDVSALAVKASRWSDGSYHFLKRCSDAGNVEASYTLGMICFYSLSNRSKGTSLMAKAAMASHSPSLYSLAIIQFNGSGGSRKDKDLKAGIALCARAACMGHIDAMRELGHCLQDGYGTQKNVIEGRRLLLEANAREAAAATAASLGSFMEAVMQSAANSTYINCPDHFSFQSSLSEADIIQRVLLDHVRTLKGGDVECHPFQLLQNNGCSLLSDFGCNVPPAKLHVASTFLMDWFNLSPPRCGLRLCSHATCGRSETRKHEFRRCSACGSVNYCSRACQALDWKARHKYDCRLIEDWEEEPGHDDAAFEIMNEF